MKIIAKLFLLLVCIINITLASETELTNQEKEYIHNNTIKIGMVDEYYPFSYKESGNINGFSYEYFKLLASKVNLKYDIQLNNWSRTLENFKNKQIDIIDAISYKDTRTSYTNFTEPYFEIPNVIFIQKNTVKDYKGLESLRGKKIGITKGIYYYDKIKSLDLFELVPYESSREKIKDLAFGKIDAAFNNLTSGQKYVLQGAYTNLEVLDQISEKVIKKEDLRLGITKENKILYSIITKATNQITSSEKINLYNKYFGTQKIKKQSNIINLTEEEKAFIKSNPIIKVHNESNWPPYNYTQNGIPLGFSIDIMNLIAERTGLKVKYITGPTWNQFLNMMKDGSLDVMLNIVKTPQREKYLLYTSSYAKNPNIIISKKNRPYKNIESLYGKTVAITKGFFSEEILNKNYPQIHILQVKNNLEGMKAVTFGQADATIGELAPFNYFSIEHGITDLTASGEALLGGPEFSLLNIATRKDLPILHAILSKGVNSITLKEKRDLQNKWLINTLEQTDAVDKTFLINLNENEKEYLSKKQSIKMCIDPNWMPFEAFDKNGEYIGISSDYYKYFKKTLGIDFEVVKTNSWNQTLEFAKQRKCDILSMAMQTPDRSKYLNFTRPYLESPLVIVSKMDISFINTIEDLKLKKVGITKGYAFVELLKNKYPYLNLIEVNDIDEGLKKVNNRELDVFIGTFPSVGYSLQLGYQGELKIAGKLSEEWKLGIGIRNDDVTLLNILQKAVNTLTLDQKREILNKWISVKYDSKIDYTLLWYILISSSVIILLLIYRQYSIKKINKELERLSITDALTNIYNRRYFNEIFPKVINSAKRKNELVSFIIMDIDYFKQYNDIYGHQMGDEVLTKVAKAIKDSLQRVDDYCFRLGGEEFGVLFKTESTKKAEQFANIIRSNIENLHIEHRANNASPYVTVSMGLISKRADNIKNEDEIYKQVDDLLYKAKENGKNIVCI